MWTFIWLVTMVFGRTRDGLESTDRLVPPGYQGNPWGRKPTRREKAGQFPPVVKDCRDATMG